MVKGISRQVIVVRSPDPKLFEQAIFILRENALGKDGMSDRAILRQAQQAAGSYVPSGKQRRHLTTLKSDSKCCDRQQKLQDPVVSIDGISIKRCRDQIGSQSAISCTV